MKKIYICIIIMFIAGSPLYSFDTQTYNGHSVVKNRVLIKFKDTSNTAEKNRILNIIGGRWKRGNTNILPFSVVELIGDTTIDTAIAVITGDTTVEWIEPDNVKHLYYNPVYPTDTNFPDQYYLNQSSDMDIDAPEAWGRMDNPGGSPNIIIAVLDSGAQLTHQDLVKNLYKDTGDPVDGIDNDGDGYTDEYDGFDFVNGTVDTGGTSDVYTDDKWVNDADGPEDDNNHGSEVSGIIAASIEDTGQIQSTAGIAYNCKILPVKIADAAGSVSTSDAIAGIYFAVSQKADIINGSYGGSTYSSAEYDAVTYALNKGVILVYASGNDASDLDDNDAYPIEYSSDIIGVGSVGKTGIWSAFSNHGAAIDIVSFGEDIVTTKINGYTDGAPVDGTSFSCPQVAAACALLLSEKPSLNSSEIENILKQTAVDVGSAGWDEYYGYGILNLAGAVKMLQFSTRRGEQLVVYPNPFRVHLGGYCVIEPTESVTNLTVKIYTQSGRLVRRLDSSTEISDFDSDGSKEARWDGLNESGHRVAPGLYIAGASFDSGKSQGRVTVINW